MSLPLRCPDDVCATLLQPCEGGEEWACPSCGTRVVVDKVTGRVLLKSRLKPSSDVSGHGMPDP